MQVRSFIGILLGLLRQHYAHPHWGGFNEWFFYGIPASRRSLNGRVPDGAFTLKRRSNSPAPVGMPEGEMLLGPATAEVLAASQIGLGHGAGGTAMQLWRTIRAKTRLDSRSVNQCKYVAREGAAGSALCEHITSPEGCGDVAPKPWIHISSNAIA
jgi:hypothetical protein